MMSRQNVLNNLRALDVNLDELCKIGVTDSQLYQIYLGLARCINNTDHLDDPVYSHAWQRDFYGMQACYFCHVRLNGETEALRDLA